MSMLSECWERDEFEAIMGWSKEASDTIRSSNTGGAGTFNCQGGARRLLTPYAAPTRGNIQACSGLQWCTERGLQTMRRPNATDRMRCGRVKVDITLRLSDREAGIDSTKAHK